MLGASYTKRNKTIPTPKEIIFSILERHVNEQLQLCLTNSNDSLRERGSHALADI